MNLNDFQIQTVIAIAIFRAIVEYIRNNLSQQNFSGPFEIQNPVENDISDDNENGNLKAENVGFFDFDYEDFININVSVVNIEKYVFYRDVYVFIDRFKDLINLKKEDRVREILSTCLRGGVFI